MKLLSLGKSIVGIFGATTISFLTWGAMEANNTHNKYQYNKKIEQYSKWRKEFYDNKLYDETYMCSSYDFEKCLNDLKDYLPKPNEDKLWIEAYDGLNSNRQSVSNFSKVKTPEQLKDHCYKEVYESIKKYKDENQKEYFQANKQHDRCVLKVSDSKT